LPLKASSPSIGKYSKSCKKFKKTILINPSNHFICLLINDCRDGRGATTHSCFASPPKKSKAKFDLFQCHKVQQEDHFGTKHSGHQEDHYGTEGVHLYNFENLDFLLS